MDRREVMRQVGENAQRELYLSWESAVTNACKRYEVVLDGFRRGLYPPHDAPGDELLRDTAKWLDTVNRLRAVREQLRAAMDEDVRQWQDEVRENRLRTQENRRIMQEKLDRLRRRIDRYL